MYCHSYFSDPTSCVLVCFFIFYYQLYSVRMPAKKRAAPKTSMASATSTRAKRPRASTLNSVSDSVQFLVGETSSTRGTVSLDVSAISVTVSAVVSQAIKTARKYSCSSRKQLSSSTHFACVFPGFLWRY